MCLSVGRSRRIYYLFTIYYGREIFIFKLKSKLKSTLSSGIPTCTHIVGVGVGGDGVITTVKLAKCAIN